MLIVNGDFPGEQFYSETVSVEENTEYVFSVWICNLDSRVGDIPPKLRVTVRSGGGEILFDQNLDGDLSTTTVPTWNQIRNGQGVVVTTVYRVPYLVPSWNSRR